MSGQIHTGAHYSMRQINTMEDVRAHFPDGKANSMNWCFLSTSGVHGHSLSLDGIEAIPLEDKACFPPEDAVDTITVLIVQPRLVAIRYGDIPFEPSDVPWLRELVASTVKAVAESQHGNT